MSSAQLPGPDAARINNQTIDSRNGTDEFNLSDGNADRYLRPQLTTTLARQYTSLQEHAEQVQRKDHSADNSAPTSRHESRREGFTLTTEPEHEDQSYSRSPLPPQSAVETPPTWEEMLRYKTNDDADTVQNATLPSADPNDIETYLAKVSTNSTKEPSLSRTDTGRSSIVGFAHGLARHIPDMRLFAQHDKPFQRIEDDRRQCSHSRSSGEDSRPSRPERRLSFILPPSMKKTGSRNQLQQSQIPTTTTGGQHVQKAAASAPPKSSFKERRKVNLDLELPVNMPDLPPRSRMPIDQQTSITLSRPRSPKTPWIRNEPPTWSRNVVPMKSPIMEESHVRSGNANVGRMSILPGNDIISSSQSPPSERSLRKNRDRYYISRPQFKRHRSGRSGTSESTPGQAIDVELASDEREARQEQHANTVFELQRLSQVSKASRSRRCRWTSPWASRNRSSEETPLPSPSCTRRRSLANPFKRSPRISERPENEVQTSQSLFCRILREQKEPVAGEDQARSLAHMHVPPPFVPPGQNRLPTPPSLNANGEIRGKLADFFFDHGTGNRARRPKMSPEGHWDSDALLMSYMSSDVPRTDEESEEGPEGPVKRVTVPRTYSNDPMFGHGTPGLVETPRGYLSAKGPDSATVTPSFNAHNMWLSNQQNETIADSTLTSLALREEDERRKFEWLVPEHLANSPLCPVHPTYQGYSKGMCYWHGLGKSKVGVKMRMSGELTNGQGQERIGRVETGKAKARSGGRVWNVGRLSPPEKAPAVKKRRLASLSSP